MLLVGFKTMFIEEEEEEEEEEKKERKKMRRKKKKRAWTTRYLYNALAVGL